MTPTPRSVPRDEIDVGTVPPTREGSPPAPHRGSRVSQAEHRPLPPHQRPQPAVRRPPRTSGAVRCGVWFYVRSLHPCWVWGGAASSGLPRPLASGQEGAGRVRTGGNLGRDPSSALDASLTIRSLVTQASRFESLRGSGNINLSTNARGDVGRSLSRGPDASNRSRNWSGPHRRTTSRAAAQTGGLHCVESVHSATRALRGPGRRRRSGRRGQAPKGTGWMPRRHPSFGRGRLRNVRGSCPTSVDPGIPETTEGTETSQYLQEKKATAIPSVAASERGTA